MFHINVRIYLQTTVSSKKTVTLTLKTTRKSNPFTLKKEVAGFSEKNITYLLYYKTSHGRRPLYVHNCVNNSPPLIHFSSQTNFNTTLPSATMSSKWSLAFRSTIGNLMSTSRHSARSGIPRITS